MRLSKKDFAETYHAFVMCSFLMFFFIVHLLTGWFRWIFLPKVWVGQVKDLESGWGYDKYGVDMDIEIKRIKRLNRRDDKVRIITRVHPVLIDETIFYVKTPNYNAKFGEYGVRLK